MATLGSKVQYSLKKIKFFAMTAQSSREFGSFPFAPELRETNQMAV
jgi:hypothetical protein